MSELSCYNPSAAAELGATPHEKRHSSVGDHSNTAWTDFADVIAMTQVDDEPLQSPVHPTNRRFFAALALSFTVRPVLKDLLVSEHFVLQRRLPETIP